MTKGFSALCGCAVALALLWPAAVACAGLKKPDGLSRADHRYLLQLARDTWACMDHFRSPATGFPYDSNRRADRTNTTNVGLYLTSVVAAERLGFITRRQALERVKPILAVLLESKTWHGFLNNHLNVQGPTQPYPGPNALSDFNKLAAAFLVLRQAYPELRDANALFQRIDWSALWDKQRDGIGMGFDVVNGTLYNWGEGWFASDARLAIFLGVATRQLPFAAWERMERRRVRQFDLEFYRPAWDYAGLFMHAMEGLFLDERYMAAGISAANFALAQMLFARQNGYPAWGWSACDIPGVGYTIEGRLSEAVIAPYASALMISYYPKRVIENLRQLERLGCRAPYAEGGKTYAFGFKDSLNLTTGEVSSLYFTGLDQAMLFLALANYLGNGCIWELFEKDPVVQAGLEMTAPTDPAASSWKLIYAQRDAQPFSLTAAARNMPERAPMVIDDGQDTGRNTLGHPRGLELENCPADRFTWRIDPDGGGTVRLEYRLAGQNQARVRFIEPLRELDLSGYNAITFRCRARTPERGPLDFRMSLQDGLESRALGFIEGVGPEWETVVFPLELFRGIVADRNRARSLVLHFEMAPEFMPANRLQPDSGTLWLDDLQLVRLDPAALRAAVWQVRRRRELDLAADGLVSGLGKLSGWQTFADADSSFQLKADAVSTGLDVAYQLGKNGRWVAWEKTFQRDLHKNFILTFAYQAEGDPNVLEVKLFSPSGAVFGRNVPFKPTGKDWVSVKLNKSDLGRLWGGQTSDMLSVVEKFGFAVSGSPKTKGKVRVRDLRLMEVQTR